jgi:DNA-binding MarR family transcriptional regulator
VRTVNKTKTNTTPSTLDAHLGFWLRFVSNHVSARFGLLIAQEGCSVVDWVALRALYDRPGSSHAELIQLLGMTKGATSKVISRLEERGLATRNLAQGSSREQLLRLTPKGMKLVPRLAALADANDAHFFAQLPQQEQNALLNILKTLVAHNQLQGLPVN